VVVQGAGPLGLMFVLRARIMGAGDIVVVDSAAYRLALAERLGATHVLSLEATSAAERVERVRERGPRRSARTATCARRASGSSARRTIRTRATAPRSSCSSSTATARASASSSRTGCRWPTSSARCRRR
jgi:threonine dehydrogenase-like Zn-dependent dehydrogenase